MEERTKHVVVSPNETRSLDVVREAAPGGPHGLASVRVELPAETESQEDARLTLESLDADPGDGERFNFLLMREAMGMFAPRDGSWTCSLSQREMAAFDGRHEPGLALFMVNILHRLDLAECGVSIGTSWLTERGLAVRDMLMSSQPPADNDDSDDDSPPAA